MPEIQPTHIVHKVPFVRTGSCNQCGACNCKKFNCPHFSLDQDGLTLCSIHDKLNEVCKICTNSKSSGFYEKGREIIHKMCADFPDHPWLKVIRNGECSYHFEEIKTDGISKFDELNAIWSKQG